MRLTFEPPYGRTKGIHARHRRSQSSRRYESRWLKSDCRVRRQSGASRSTNSRPLMKVVIWPPVARSTCTTRARSTIGSPSRIVKRNERMLPEGKSTAPCIKNPVSLMFRSVTGTLSGPACAAIRPKTSSRGLRRRSIVAEFSTAGVCSGVPILGVIDGSSHP